MSDKSWQISRRTVLRGMGATIALPMLNAMTPLRPAQAATAAASGAAKPPVRMACIFFPNGVWEDSWVPTSEGSEYLMPYSLRPLTKFRREFNVLSGLDQANSRQGDGHYAKTGNFLTGLPVNKTTGRDISAGGISMDQLAAQMIGHNTPLPSLEMGIDPVISGIDSNVGYTRLYGSYISWRNAHTPVAREINPRFVYERLFGAQNAGAEGAQQRRQEDFQSLIDLALEDAKGLRRNLGRDDQVKLDEYLESVRSVERRIEFSLRPDPREWMPEVYPDLADPGDIQMPADFREHVKLMMDLLVLAFQTDSTRVASFMFANCVSGRNFSFLNGVSGGHHDMSHHENKPEKIAQYRRITRWHSEQLAYLLEKMQAVPEGDGTLLDNSMVLFGSSMSDGNRHDPNNLPIVLAGKAGGAFKTGYHFASNDMARRSRGEPLCNLYTTMLQTLGADVESFGDAEKPYARILAQA
jgi:hypothetical protein